MKVNTDPSAIAKLLSLGVAEVIVKKELEKKLASGKVLKVKLGIDPTGFDLHLGHMVVLHKLREFQEMGHKIILIFGNFTGQIGDPTGKDTTRNLLSQEELENNAKDYLKQASCILDAEKVDVRWNADWLAPLSFKDVVQLASNFTVAQMLERDMFQERIKNEKPISVHEFMYPLMQGYDSVALEADIELGGTDQTFNLHAGRRLQEAYGQTPQSLMTLPILVGTDGKIKMGKSTGNYIAVADSPEEMFGKIMSIPDELLLNYFELGARFTEEKLKKIQARLDTDENPRNLKIELAKEIIKIYHGEEGANQGEEHFKTVFQKKEIPEEVFLDPSYSVTVREKSVNIIELIMLAGFAKSTSEARRFIKDGGVKWNQEKVKSIEEIFEIKNRAGESSSDKPDLLQVGKRNFRVFYWQ